MLDHSYRFHHWTFRKTCWKGHSFDFAKVTAMCQQHKGFEALSLNLMQMDQVGMVTLPSV